MKTVAPRGSSSLLEAIKAHGTWFTISAVAIVVILGITLVNDPTKWWIALVVALGLSLFLFTVANGRVVLKAIGSLVVLLFSVAGANSLGATVDTVSFLGLVWPSAQIATYLLALALSYAVYSGRGRWTYLGLMALSQFAITSGFLMFGADSYISVGGAALASFGGFTAAYLFNGRTRVSSKMPETGFSQEFLEALVKGAAQSGKKVRIVPARKGIDSHLIVYDKRAVIIYPVALEQAFGILGRRGSRLGYRNKDINPWLLRLSYFTSPSWKTRGASPALVLVDVNRKNGGEGKIIGVSLPDSKRKAAVGVQPAPPSRKDRDDYGRRIIANSFRLMRDFELELTDKQLDRLSRVGYGVEDIEEFSQDLPEDAELNLADDFDGVEDIEESPEESDFEETPEGSIRL